MLELVELIQLTLHERVPFHSLIKFDLLLVYLCGYSVDVCLPVFAEVHNLALVFFRLCRGCFAFFDILRSHGFLVGNDKRSDSLRLEGEGGVAYVLGLLEQCSSIDQLVANADPFLSLADFFLEVSLRPEIGYRSLLEGDRHVLLDACIRLLPEILGEFHEIDVLDRGLALSRHVEPVRQVFDSNKYFVATERMHPIGQLIRLADVLRSLKLNQ